MSTIAIQYPPDFDGELHIEHSEKAVLPHSPKSWKEHTFSFTVADNAMSAETPWEVLVQVAKDILAQEERCMRK